MVPHGMAVALTAPEAFRFTFMAAPEPHLRAARPLEPGAAQPADPAALLPQVLVRLMRDIGMRNGIAGVGYAEADVDGLVEGTLKQQRILSSSPRELTNADAAGTFARSLSLW
jgi:hydroxyacid-oxoacid transhydrogenase